MDKGKWLGIAATICLAACASLSGPGKADLYRHSQRLVIQFKPDSLGCDAASIAALSRATGLSLKLVRPMGKGACVVNQFASHPDQIRKQQNKIAAHDSVQWVEPDQRVRTY